MKILLLLTIIFCLVICSCKSTSTLNIEAKVIYNMGGPQPVARQNFYLLNRDPFVGGDNPKFKEKFEAAKTDEEKAVLTLSATLLYSLKLVVIDKQPLKNGDEKLFLGIVDKSKRAWDGYLVKEVTTDFDGKAKIEDVPPGNYWLFGQTETRAAFTLWDLPIEVIAGENKKILLDQNNAIFSK